MLGKLARELRLLGMDVAYERNLAGMAAYRVARQQGRILLTRANRLRELAGVVFINSTAAAEQVAEVKAALASGLKPPVPVKEQPSAVPAPSLPSVAPLAALPLPAQPESAGHRRSDQRRYEHRREVRPRREEPIQPTAEFGRCLECNTPLEKITREQARPQVPFFVYQIHYEFRRCPKCRKVFWPGSHVADMEKRTRPPVRRSVPPRRRPEDRRPSPNE